MKAILRETLETLLLALLIFWIVNSAVRTFRVEGSSMEPNFHDGQLLVVNKLVYAQIGLPSVLAGQQMPTGKVTYLFHAPRRGEVIVFKLPQRPYLDYIKRVLGEPGDVVAIREGVVYVNGVAQEEPYIASPSHDTYGPVTVPPSEYFVLGDNRRNSSDSRSWGMVPVENVIGTPWVIYWPLDNFGIVSRGAVRAAHSQP